MNWTALYFKFMTDHPFLLALMAEGYVAAVQSNRSDVAFNLTQNSYNAYGLFSSLDSWGIPVKKEAFERVARSEMARRYPPPRWTDL